MAATLMVNVESNVAADGGLPEATAAAVAAIDSTPREKQVVKHEGKEYITVKEGLAYILTPQNLLNATDPKRKLKEEDDGQLQSVFYNPIQQFNRDLSVLAIRAFGEDLLDRRKRAHEGQKEKQKAKASGRGGRGKKRGEEEEVDAVKPDKTKSDIHQHHRRAAELADTVAQQPTRSDDPKSGVPAEAHVPTLANDTSKKRKREEGDSKSVEEESIPEPDVTDGMKTDSVEWKQTRDISRDASAAAPPKRSKSNGVDNGSATERQEVQEHSEAGNAEWQQNERGQAVDVDGRTGSTANGITNGSVTARVDARQTTAAATHQRQTPKRSKIRILDALSASGLRALRYAQELPYLVEVTANDMSAAAVDAIRINVKHNRLGDRITANTGNAVSHLYGIVARQGPSVSEDYVGKYDVIDLDPYGTAVPFLDASLQALTDGGLLCVTCTDTAVLVGTGYPEKTYSLYGGMPLKGLHCHESGLRLILHGICTAAARYGLAVEPLLSLSIDFYARVFVRVKKSPAEVKFLAGKQMLVYNCDSGCGAWSTQFLGTNKAQRSKDGSTFYKHGMAQAPSADRVCEHCGFKTHLAGPMYGGPLHNPAFIGRLLDYMQDLDKDTYGTKGRIEGMLHTALEEVLSDPFPTSPAKGDKGALIPSIDPAATEHHPFFFNPSALARILHCQAPSDSMMRGALRHAGYRVTRSHTKPGTLKTDAPWSAIWEMMREWVKQKAPVKEGAIKKGSAGWAIMEKAKKREQEEVETASESAGDKEGSRQSTCSANEQRADAAATPEKPSRHGAVKLEVVFDERLGREECSSGKKLLRYQSNPRANWGPMTRAKSGREQRKKEEEQQQEGKDG